jgi:superfamily I DNA/RNA helicase
MLLGRLDRMAIIIPALEEINRLKQKPTKGEQTLLTFLQELNNEYTVYFQPFLNGSLPDFIILHKTKGILVIEVKDWDLNSYNIINKDWYVNKNQNKVRKKSPIKQVEDYKDLIYSYVEGFVEDSILNRKKYGYLKTAVYFHKSSEKDAFNFCRECRHNKGWVSILGNDSLSFERFRNISYFKNQLTDDFSNYYEEFQLLFAPSKHMLELGEEIKYSKSQQKLIKSKKEEIKIKGVAGSGKTLVLAKRAVNAHIRTKNRILILTYNITLRNFIRDKLNQVREEFPWTMFHIDNYHNFIATMKNEYCIDESQDDDNELFEGIDVQTYDAIFIDEIQDYKIEWQTLIKKYFLSPNGELVVFGDEKQNIYGNALENRDISTIVNNEWHVLNESFRLSSVISDISLNYFEKYLKNRYQKLEFIFQQEFSFNYGYIGNLRTEKNLYFEDYCDYIVEYIRKNKIPYNDVVILGRHIDTLRELEYIFRNKYRLNITKTFEKKETYQLLTQEYGNMKWLLEDKIKKVRRSEKMAFQMNRGTIKMSTIHSFKGWEAENVFIILENPRGEEAGFTDEELIYTGITRSKNNLVFINLNLTKYNNFLESNREIVEELNIYDLIIPNIDKSILPI